MDRKSTKGSASRADRSKKRRFHGNRFTEKEDMSFTSASAAKLSKSGDEEVIISNNYRYCILEFFTVFTAISSLVLCATCKKEIKFSRTAHRGVGFKIALQCNCENVQYIPSSPCVNKSFEVNRRMVFVMRLLGAGREGINIFCSMMDICQGISIGTYYSCLENVYAAASAVYDLIISKAVDEEKNLISASDPNANSTNFTVSGHGTWKKRGFNSLFGVTTLVAKNSKKVVDTVVKSSFCQGCNVWRNKKNSDIAAYNDWYKEHEESCTINHKESAGKIEVDAIAEMVNRSVQKHQVKYVTLYCRPGPENRCKWQKAVHEGTSEEFDHENPPLCDNVSEIIKPIYESLSSEDLLVRCVGSETQNNNESLNSLIWTFAPKHIHAGVRTIEIATFIAVSIFNEGFIPILKMMSLLGMNIGPEANAFAIQRDNARIDRSEMRASNASKEARTARLEERNTENGFFEVEEGPMYGTGIAY